MDMAAILVMSFRVVSEKKSSKMLTDNWQVTFGQGHQMILISRISRASVLIYVQIKRTIATEKYTFPTFPFYKPFGPNLTLP